MDGKVLDTLKTAGIGILATIGAATLLKPVAGHVKAALPDMEKVINPEALKHFPLLTQEHKENEQPQSEKQEMPKQHEKQHEDCETRSGEHDFK